MIMTATQFAALVVGMLVVFIGAAVKIIRLLIRLVLLFEDFKRMSASHETRIVQLETTAHAHKPATRRLNHDPQ